MMSWEVLDVTYCIKQYEVNGRVADSMLINTTLMLVYITKFFLVGIRLLEHHGYCT
ncbi:hypothetical protein I3842_01G088300 [Carya illinoinensis]|uniref:Uncharacterized protein n=1 Tax=Carya illinoinensis TaxID=32201 RepID=A0A922FYB3_CARIL|nr:hypothetical protein I3842_01G088300 [Carya illinoinensis]